jgi:hypothetical protein
MEQKVIQDFQRLGTKILVQTLCKEESISDGSASNAFFKSKLKVHLNEIKKLHQTVYINLRFQFDANKIIEFLTNRSKEYRIEMVTPKGETKQMQRASFIKRMKIDFDRIFGTEEFVETIRTNLSVSIKQMKNKCENRDGNGSVVINGFSNDRSSGVGDDKNCGGNSVVKNISGDSRGSSSNISGVISCDGSGDGSGNISCIADSHESSSTSSSSSSSNDRSNGSSNDRGDISCGADSRRSDSIDDGSDKNCIDVSFDDGINRVGGLSRGSERSSGNIIFLSRLLSNLTFDFEQLPILLL